MRHEEGISPRRQHLDRGTAGAPAVGPVALSRAGPATWTGPGDVTPRPVRFPSYSPVSGLQLAGSARTFLRARIAGDGAAQIVRPDLGLEAPCRDGCHCRPVIAALGPVDPAPDRDLVGRAPVIPEIGDLAVKLALPLILRDAHPAIVSW
jgi:hypothetical protein